MGWYLNLKSLRHAAVWHVIRSSHFISWILPDDTHYHSDDYAYAVGWGRDVWMRWALAYPWPLTGFMQLQVWYLKGQLELEILTLCEELCCWYQRMSSFQFVVICHLVCLKPTVGSRPYASDICYSSAYSVEVIAIYVKKLFSSGVHCRSICISFVKD